ncbi:MAG: FAD:protein FMN transferase [Lachnospiraceae bacterium]|jgi:thiamine biosynthesis lipoprotein|nr:FAD:protein FMN transferase [Lachnospiraceae bacterium]
MKRRQKILGIGLCLVFLIGGISYIKYQEEQKSCTKQLFAMDTFMSFTAYGKNCEKAVDAAIDEVERLDALLSTGKETSEVSRINAAGGGEVSEDTAVILQEAMEVYQRTEGLFDVSIYPLMELWGFPSQEYHVPTREELLEVLSLVDASKIAFDGTYIKLLEGQRIDFGGIAKGYTSARVMDVFQEYGIHSGMVTLGGNVQVLNKKLDGSKWQVAIRDPEHEGKILGVLGVENQAVITSGGYERYFEEDGETYIHILNPRTGYPADKDLISVTVISEDGMLADALSTSLYLMGREEAVSYWERYGEEFEMVLVTEKGEILVTEGICEEFETEEEYLVID